MTGDHSSKLTELKPDELRVHFSPELKRNFARLEAAVCESEHFGPEMLRVLQDLAEGIPTTVRSTILAVAAVVHETGSYMLATGDTKPDELLSTIIDGMMPFRGGPEPITVVKNKVNQGRAS